jgi:large subunit ribosomal protein L17
MKHRIFGKKLGRNRNQRQGLFRSQTKALFTHSYINTTQAKAKALIPMVEKICTLAKKNDLSAKREIYKIFQDRKQVDMVCKQINLVFPDSNSNFTKMTRVKVRQGDDALIVKLHFVKDISFKEEPVEKEKSKAKTKVKPKAKPKAVKKPAVEKKTTKVTSKKK